MAATKPILYNYYRSSCSWRVRIALACKGISYEYKSVDLSKREQKSEEYLKINPLGEIPALVNNGSTITNSTAILEYLEEIFPKSPLLPSNPVARAQVRGIVDAIASGIQPLQHSKIISYTSNTHPTWAKHWIESGFSSLEKVLERTHGKYCFGNEVTLADLCLVPQADNAADRFDVKLSNFPLILDIYKRLMCLEAFQVSHPNNQPDNPRFQTKQI